MIRKFDVAYFAASTDDAETNKRFAESLDADYPILSDPDKKVAGAYGVLMPERGFANRWTFAARQFAKRSVGLGPAQRRTGAAGTRGSASQAWLGAARASTHGSRRASGGGAS